MPLVVAEGKRIFFAHVPKAGGTSVEDYLVRRFGGPLSLRMVRPRDRDPFSALVVSATHLTRMDLEHVMPQDVGYFFAVVRDPMSRLESQFRFQSGVSRIQRLGFSVWLRTILAAAKIDPRIYRNHIRPQSDLVPEDSKVFKLEEGLSDMVDWLDRITNTEAPKIEMDHLLKRPKKPVPISRDDARLIANFYASDYERFSYLPPDLSCFPDDKFPVWKRPIVKLMARGLVARQRYKWVH